MSKKLDVFLFYLANFIFIFFHRKDGFAGMALVLILLAIYFRLYFKNLTLAFILCLVFISNPGRMISNMTAFGFSVRFLYFRDLFFYLGFLCLFSPKIKHIAYSISFKKLLPFLYLFSFYQIFISLFYKLEIYSFFTFLKSLEEFKVWIFGIFIILPCYKIIQLDSKLFLKTLYILAAIYSIVFLISIYSDFHIIQFRSELRLRGSSITRILVHNAEIFKLSIYVAFSVFFVSHSKNNWKIYLAGILSFAIPIIGMYRLESTYTILTLLLLSYLLFKYFGAKVNKALRIIFFTSCAVLIMIQLIPAFMNQISSVFESTFNEFFGTAVAGTSQTRTVYELPNQLHLIKDNLALGVGFRPEWWQNFTNYLDWGLSDIPLTGTLAMYGIIGMLIYYSRFIKLISDSIVFYKFVRLNGFQEFKTEFQLEVLTVVAIGAYFVCMITFRAFYVSWELTLAYLSPQFAAFMGMFYGLQNIIYEQDTDSET